MYSFDMGSIDRFTSSLARILFGKRDPVEQLMIDLDSGKCDAQLEASAGPLKPVVPEYYDTLKPFDVDAWLRRKV